MKASVLEVRVEDDTEEWYLRRASMVFPTVEAAKEVTKMEGPVAGHCLVLKWGGVPQSGGDA